MDLLYAADQDGDAVAARARELLKRRHGAEDFTITTQDQMLEVLGSVLDVLTAAVGALGGISLAVGGVGILTIMTIAVRERRREIGLLRALGAGQGQILALFLGEAVLLASLGGLAGLPWGPAGPGLLGASGPGPAGPDRVGIRRPGGGHRGPHRPGRRGPAGPGGGAAGPCHGPAGRISPCSPGLGGAGTENRPYPPSAIISLMLYPALATRRPIPGGSGGG